MPLDSPYYVVRSEYAKTPCYTIHCVGDGAKCRTDDGVFAYHLIDLLNEEYRREKSNARAGHQDRTGDEIDYSAAR